VSTAEPPAAHLGTAGRADPLAPAGPVPEPVAFGRTLEPGEGIAFAVRTGWQVRLAQVEGRQVADLVSFPLDDLGERLSMYASRRRNGAWKLTAPHVLCSAADRPLWTIEADTVAENYCGGGYCNPRANQVRYGEAGANTCEHNLARALAPHGFDRRGFDPDVCFNIFMRVDYDEDGSWAIRESVTDPGDHIVLRAECDQLVGLSNCPQVLSPVNSFSLKRLRLDVTA
jgi:uncharacterized protein YcgI (DUF1989 family)